MSAEVNPSVEEEVPQADAQATDTEQVQQTPQESPQEKKRRNDAEYNWAEMRKKQQELERQNQELRSYVEKSTKPPQVEEDPLDKLSDDDIVTKAQAKKLAEKMAKQIANEVIKQREAATVDERLQLKYTDFNQIVTAENIEYLKQTEPELAESLRYHPDPYAQGIAAYKMLKRIAGSREPQEPMEKKKAIENSQKPVSSQAIAKTSSLADVNQFAELDAKGRKEFLRSKYEEMQAAIKRG